MVFAPTTTPSESLLLHRTRVDLASFSPCTNHSALTLQQKPVSVEDQVINMYVVCVCGGGHYHWSGDLGS